MTRAGTMMDVFTISYNDKECSMKGQASLHLLNQTDKKPDDTWSHHAVSGSEATSWNRNVSDSKLRGLTKRSITVLVRPLLSFILPFVLLHWSLTHEPTVTLFVIRSPVRPGCWASWQLLTWQHIWEMVFFFAVVADVSDGTIQRGGAVKMGKDVAGVWLGLRLR